MGNLAGLRIVEGVDPCAARSGVGHVVGHPPAHVDHVLRAGAPGDLRRDSGGGLTGIYAPELTYDAILDAMLVLKLADRASVDTGKGILVRMAAMLTRMCR